MLDLDKYIDNSVRIKLFGEEYDVLEPTMEMVMQVDKIEKDVNEKNVNDKRIEIFLLFVNHNKQRVTFTKEDVYKIPFEAVVNTIGEISALRYEAEADPNSSSQSRKEKSDN